MTSILSGAPILLFPLPVFFIEVTLGKDFNLERKSLMVSQGINVWRPESWDLLMN
jgi:hypothetical protein